MLGKMLIHGLVAAALIGSAAAVYAQNKDNGNQAPAATAVQPDKAAAETGNGYLRPTEVKGRSREEERRHQLRADRHDGRRHAKRDHDDDDD